MSTLLGLGSLLAFNVLATAADFWVAEFPDYKSNIMFWLIFVYSIPNVLVTLIMVKYGSYISFSFRIIFCFITTAIVLAFIPFMTTIIKSQQIGYYCSLCIAVYVGFSNAMLQATTIGFTNLLPQKYTQFNIAGQCLAGILACLIQILCKMLDKTSDGNSNNNYVISGRYYFIIGAVGDIVCAIGFVYVINGIFVKFHLDRKNHRVCRRYNNNNNGYARFPRAMHDDSFTDHDDTSSNELYSDVDSKLTQTSQVSVTTCKIKIKYDSNAKCDNNYLSVPEKSKSTSKSKVKTQSKCQSQSHPKQPMLNPVPPTMDVIKIVVDDSTQCESKSLQSNQMPNHQREFRSDASTYGSFSQNNFDSERQSADLSKSKLRNYKSVWRKVRWPALAVHC